MNCNCGCGNQANSNFLPGHDQKLRARLEKKVGGLHTLERLVNGAHDFANGSQPIASLEALIQEIFQPAPEA